MSNIDGAGTEKSLFPIGQILTDSLSQLPVGSQDDCSRISVGHLSSGHNLTSQIHLRLWSNAPINTVYPHKNTLRTLSKEYLPLPLSPHGHFTPSAPTITTEAGPAGGWQWWDVEGNVYSCVSAMMHVTMPHICNLRFYIWFCSDWATHSNYQSSVFLKLPVILQVIIGLFKPPAILHQLSYHLLQPGNVEHSPVSLENVLFIFILPLRSTYILQFYFRNKSNN